MSTLRFWGPHLLRTCIYLSFYESKWQTTKTVLNHSDNDEIENNLWFCFSYHVDFTDLFACLWLQHNSKQGGENDSINKSVNKGDGRMGGKKSAAKEGRSPPAETNHIADNSSETVPTPPPTAAWEREETIPTPQCNAPTLLLCLNTRTDTTITHFLSASCSPPRLWFSLKNLTFNFWSSHLLFFFGQKYGLFYFPSCSPFAFD